MGAVVDPGEVPQSFGGAPTRDWGGVGTNIGRTPCHDWGEAEPGVQASGTMREQRVGLA